MKASMLRNFSVLILLFCGANSLFDDAPPGTQQVAELVIQAGHSWTVSALAVSRDGNLLATGGGDKGIRIWDLQTGQIVRAFDGVCAGNYVTSLDFSPDDQWIVSTAYTSATFDAQPKLWSIKTGACREFPGLDQNSEVNGLMFIQVGSRSVLANGYFAWDAASLKKEDSPLRDPNWVANRSLISRDGRRLLVYALPNPRDEQNSTELRVVDAASGHLLRSIARYKMFEGPNSIAISPDGEMVAAGNDDWDVSLWRVSDGSIVHVFPAHFERGPEDDIAFAPDGKTIALAGKGGVALWDIASAKLTRSFLVADGTHPKIAFTPDGKTLIAAGYMWGTVARWDVASGAPKPLAAGSVIPISSACISRDGGRLATLDREKIQVWDLADLKPLRQVPPIAWPSETSCMALSPDGRAVAVGGGDNNAVTATGTIEVYSIGDDARPQPLLFMNADPNPGYISKIKYSVDGSVLATFHSDARGRSEKWCYWDAATLKEIKQPVPEPAWFNPVEAGKRRLETSPDGSVHIMDGGGRMQAVLRVLAVQQPDRDNGFGFTFSSPDWLWNTPDNHWCGSPGAASYVSWRVNGEIRSVDAFPSLHDEAAVMAALRTGDEPGGK